MKKVTLVYIVEPVGKDLEPTGDYVTHMTETIVSDEAIWQTHANVLEDLATDLTRNMVDELVRTKCLVKVDITRTEGKVSSEEE